ncbi:hypothetical protein ACTJNK_26110 [Achromobacter anxifer]
MSLNDQSKTALLSKLRAPVADERAAFEAEYVDHCGMRLEDYDFAYDPATNRYRDDCEQSAWWGWHTGRAALASAPVAGEATDDGPIVGRITVKSKGRSSVDLDASHADLPIGKYLIFATSESAPKRRMGWTDDQMISFAGMVLFKGVSADSIEQLLSKFRELEAIRGHAAPRASPEPVGMVLDERRDTYRLAVVAPGMRPGDSVYAAPQASEAVRDTALTALQAARQFINNGIELGFIRMPDADVPDPAHRTPGLIDAAIRALSAQPGAQKKGGSNAN